MSKRNNQNKSGQLRNDLNRIGLFQEMGYLRNDPKDNIKQKDKNSLLRRPFWIPGSKSKGADQSGYFDPLFLRASEGDPYKTIADYFRKKDKSKPLHGPFRNAPIIQMDCGKGSYCATINPCPKAMSTELKKKKTEEFKNSFSTTNSKKGTGYGYLDITINPYIPFADKPTDLKLLRKKSLEENTNKRLGGHFRSGLPQENNNIYTPMKAVTKTKAKEGRTSFKHYPHNNRFKYLSFPKKDGGMKAGTLNPFPVYNSGPYKEALPLSAPIKEIRNDKGKIFTSTSRVRFNKSWVQPSVIETNLRKKLNANNYKSIASVIGFKTCPC